MPKRAKVGRSGPTVHEPRIRPLPIREVAIEGDMVIRLLDTVDEPAPERETGDLLAPARGIVIGLVLSAVLWVLLAFFAFFALHV